jgi:RNase P/RNase MRP subunit p29
MKIKQSLFTCLTLVSLSACNSATDIIDLALPEAETIEGKVLKLEENAFVMKDETSVITVRPADAQAGDFKLLVGEKIRVQGVVDTSNLQAFNAYSITRQDGEHQVFVYYE